MTQNMMEHHAAVTIDAPLHQVYSLFSHFNDFPKFMSFVKEVTYYDDQRSHWVADVAGRHEWDAINEDWIPDRQIGWRSVNGLNNYGRVIFQPVSMQQTHIDVYVNYQPPAGVLGTIGEHMGVGKRFDSALQTDLSNFAEMVHQAPPNALDPNSSDYLFHSGSAAAKGTTTARQNATMGREYSPENAPSSYSQGQGMRVSRSSQEMPDSSTFGNVSGRSASTDYGSTARPGSNVTGQDVTSTREDTLVDRPVMDRDIINERGQDMPPTYQQASGTPGMSDLPPEQTPSWDRREGDQPQI